MKNNIQILVSGDSISKSYKDERMIFSEASEYYKKAFFNRYFFAAEKVIRRMQKEPLQIIDAACGDGAGSAFLAEQFPQHKIFGVDISGQTIEDAIKIYSSRFSNLNYSIENVLDISKKVDVFISFETIEHIEKPEVNSFLDNIATKLLNPSGKFIVSTPRLRPRETTKRRESHINELYYQEFKYLLGVHFPMIEFYSFDRYANIVPDFSEAILMIAICSKWPETKVLI